MRRVKKRDRVKNGGVRDNTPSPDVDEDDIAYAGFAAIFSIIVYAIVKAFRSVFKKRG
jgi:hypothetical protein